MLVKRQVIRSLIAGVASGVLLIAGSAGATAQTKKAAPTKKPTQTTVQPTASEGTTATAMRGRPANPAAVKAVNGALKQALAKPAVRAAVLADLRRQLRVSRPIALVDGYWASVIDLASVYRTPNVRAELLSVLGPNGPQLTAAAGAAREGLMIAFTPNQLGQLLMPDLVQDITASFAADALRNTMTEITGAEVLFIMFVGWLAFEAAGDLIGLLLDAYYWYTDPYRSGGDLDGDGIPNRDDKDRDGDGVDNDKDNYPNDKSRSICDCGRPAVFLGAVPGDILPQLVSALTAAQKQTAVAVALGPIVSGQSGALALVF